MESKKINEITREFYIYLSNKDTSKINTLLEKYNINNFMKNKSFISLLLDYAILINNADKINFIKDSISMKRDYLKLINYYKHDNELAKNIFKQYIDIHTLLIKDIDFIIDNELYFILPFLDGIFIEFDKIGSIPKDTILTKKYLISENYVEIFKKHITEKQFDSFKSKIGMTYDYIIDAGNILHSRTGLLDNYSADDLNIVLTNFPNSLVIIHKRHLKNKHIKLLLNDKLYFETPYNFNDDIFIILAYLNKQVNIISNDTYKDHTIDNTILRNHLHDMLIKYTNNKGTIIFESVRNYTRCVQIHGDKVFIPAINGFIEIKI